MPDWIDYHAVYMTPRANHRQREDTGWLASINPWFAGISGEAPG